MANEFVQGALGGIQAAQGLQNIAFANQEEPYRLSSLQAVSQGQQADTTMKNLDIQQTQRHTQEQQAISQRMLALMKNQQLNQAAGKLGVNPADLQAQQLAETAQVQLQYGDADGADASLSKVAALRKDQADLASKQADTTAKHISAVDDMIAGGASFQDVVQYAHTYAPEALADPRMQAYVRKYSMDPTSFDAPVQVMGPDGKPTMTTPRQQLAQNLMTAKQRIELQNQQRQQQASAAREKVDDLRAKALERELLGDRDTNAALGKVGGLKPPEGYEFVFKNGKPTLDENGQPTLKPITGGPADPNSPQKGGFGSAFNKRFAARVIGASTEGEAALTSIAKMNSDTGIWAQNVVGSDRGKTITQLMTTQQQKRYNATMAGLAPEIASAQNQGLAANEDQIHALEQAITLYPEDSAQTAQYKVALGARYLRKALEGANTLMDPQQQKQAQQLIASLNKFPDPDTIDNATPGQSLFPGTPGLVGGGGRAASYASVEAAMKAGRKAGDRVTINGVTGTLQ